MNEAERELVAYLTEIKSRKIGFMNLWTHAHGLCADIDLDARYDLFASDCIFDDCTDAQAKLFLESFLAKRLCVGCSVSEQLSKLLAKRGHLVREPMDRLLMANTASEWGSYGMHQSFLSYLVVREDGAVWAGRLLDQVPADARDGLFLACFRLQSEELDRKLMAKFLEWELDEATGEIYLLEKFIAKWLELYPYQDLEGVIRVYFKHRCVK